MRRRGRTPMLGTRCQPRGARASVRYVGWLVGRLVFACLAVGAVAAAQEIDATGGPQPTVTAEVLERRIVEVEASAGLSDELKAEILALYHRASNYLSGRDAHATRAATFEEAMAAAPAELQAMREEIASLRQTEPLAGLDAGEASLPELVEQLHGQEYADLQAAEARLADLEERLASQRTRTSAIDAREDEARRRQDETAAALAAPADDGVSPTLTQARRWVLETRYAALVAEITSLDLERRSQPLRVQLAEAQRERETARAERLRARVAALGELANRQRLREAEAAAAAAQQTLQEVEGGDPRLVQLSRDNAALTQERNAKIGELDAMTKDLAFAEKLARRVEADHRDAEAAVAAGAEEDRLGRLLLEHRDSLPDVQVYRQRARVHDAMLATARVQRLHHQTELRRLDDPEQVLAALVIEFGAETDPELQARLRSLLEKRRELLARAVEVDEIHLSRLRELAAAEQDLLDAVTVHDEFLAAYLPWLRSADPTRLRDLVDLPAEFRQLLAPTAWSGLAGVFVDRVLRSVSFWLVVIVAGVLLWRRRALEAAIERSDPRPRRPDRDGIGCTLRTLGLSLAVAAPLPLLVATPGWQLQSASRGTDLSHAVGSSLLYVALQLVILLALRTTCLPRGLAIAHFRWSEPKVELLRSQLDRYTWIFIVSVLITQLVVDLNPAETGGDVARLGLLVYAAVIALFFQRVLHPRQGVFGEVASGQPDSWAQRAAPLWWLLAMACPLALAALALAGYVYSADVLQGLYQQTLWMILGLIVLYSLAMRALLVAQRRLAYRAAVEHRKAEIAARRAELKKSEDDAEAAVRFEEPEVDLDGLSDDSRELLGIATVVVGLLGLTAIWSPVLSALTVFEGVTLWSRTVTVDGEITRIPVTLASLLLALIYGVGMGVLARRLPALAEIVLLRAGVSSGARYTTTTVIRGAVVTAGIWLVLTTLGARWNQFQWLVAALGVGIGFGLQEIVANFISGLIMLFERPIRVGDTVTVGETSGVVTRIQIRATTIRGWDQKELLVPNREFITGQVLNWTLSDRVTRITLSVGVAYGTDVDLVLQLMREAAQEQERVLEDPAPILTFDGFGDSALMLSLRAYISSIDYRLATVTALHQSINQKFKEAGITVAFPQRDLYLRAPAPLSIRIDEDRPPGLEEVTE